jgi:hypothetical protein
MYIYIYIREKPCHELQIEVSQGGYQANMAASSLHGLLGLSPYYYPPEVAHTFLPAGAYLQKVGVPTTTHESHCFLKYHDFYERRKKERREKEKREKEKTFENMCDF